MDNIVIAKLDRQPRSINLPEPVTPETWEDYAERFSISLRSYAAMIQSCPGPEHLFGSIADVLALALLGLIECQDFHRNVLRQYVGVDFAAAGAVASHDALQELRPASERIVRLCQRQRQLIEMKAATSNGSADHTEPEEPADDVTDTADEPEEEQA
jgi:hypothetical protein